MTPVRWIRSVIIRRQADRDLADEIALHFEEKISELVAAGFTPEAAAREARRAFGNVTHVREQSRDVWRWRAIHDLACDVRYALRQLRHHRSFALAAILTLAVGIGANSAIFSVVNAVVFRPLPFHQPENLVSVQSMSVGGGSRPETLSYFTFFEFRRAGVFERIASYRDEGLTLTGGDLPVQLNAQIVSSDLFEVLGVPPLLGRGFLPSEEAPNARVVILSYDTWQTHFGGDPAIVGRSIVIDGEPNTVVGVAQQGFTYPIRNRPVHAWTTLARDASSATVQPITEQRGARLLHIIARLSSDTSLEQARTRIDAVASRLAAEYPSTHKTIPATYVRPELETLLGQSRGAILVLWGAVGLVLVIACANIANMLLARTADRQHELRVRMAIGGSRGRIVRQLLTENLTIAVVGAGLGIVAAIAIVRVLVAMTSDYLPRAAGVHVDSRVLAFGLGLALAVAVFVSLPAVLWIGRSDPGRAIDGSRAVTGRHERVRGALVVAQVSVGLMLLSVAGTLGAGFVHLMRRDLGFNPDNLLAFRIELPAARYTTDGQIAFIDRLLERLAAVPGVSVATAALPLPLTGDEMSISFNIEERPTGPSERPSSNVAIVSPTYFQTIATPVLAGRGFTNDDDGNHPRVVIVNQAFADRFFPGAGAIGKRIVSGATSNRDARSGGTIFREIVGIVGNARQNTGGRDPDPIYYFPYKQMPWGPPSVIVRSTIPATSILPDIRRIVAALDEQVPVHGAKTMTDVFATGLAAPRFLTVLMSSFAGLGLLLTATGLYGLLSYTVSRRTREIGVRVALGASRNGIVSMILGRALALVAIGTALGGIGMLAGHALLGRTLVLFDAQRPLIWFGAAATLVAITAVAAAYPPARRAASIDPTIALRME
jgi:predicted permease